MGNDFDAASKNLLEDELKIERFLKYMKSKTKYNYYKRKEDEENNLFLSKEELQSLVHLLVIGEYRFQNPKKVLINKMKSKKNRTVYIFEKEDKCLFQYINYVIQDVIEIHKHCYSFQKKRNIGDSIQYLMHVRKEGMVCIKTDISNYFNSISIKKENLWIQSQLENYPSLSLLIEEILLNPKVTLDDCKQDDLQKGVMAGMPLAPTLSNLYLYDFDKEMSEKFYAYARYSDDMVFFCEKEVAEKMLVFIEDKLMEKGLALNREKTKIFSEKEGFEFLGLKIQGNRVDLSPSTIQKMKRKIKRATRALYRWQKNKNVPYEKSVQVLIRKFDRKLYGKDLEDTEFTWARWFFPLLTTSEGLHEIDHYFQETIRYLATGKYSKKNYQFVSYDMLKEYGYKPLVSMFYNSEHRKST